MRQEGEQQQHENAADPYQEIQGHLRIVDFFLFHDPEATDYRDGNTSGFDGRHNSSE